MFKVSQRDLDCRSEWPDSVPAEFVRSHCAVIRRSVSPLETTLPFLRI
jgi:hypothetical protein